MNSRDPLAVQVIDLLITQALRTQTKDAQPPPHVWPRIRRRAKAWTARRQSSIYLTWSSVVACVFHDAVFSPNAADCGGYLANWRYNLVAMRFLGCEGPLLQFRF